MGEMTLLTPGAGEFLGYWNQPVATASKYDSTWLRTADLATVDEDGYIWFKGRGEDVWSSQPGIGSGRLRSRSRCYGIPRRAPLLSP
jgi:acyl-coenzyme A synthetase/AMP-(fatty) acid ligase